MDNDFLLDCLRRLRDRLSPDNALEGRQKIADATKLSDQYLYQLLDEKPLASGQRRSIGVRARKQITAAFPNWMDALPGYSLPSADREFILQVEQEVAHYAVPEHIRQSIISLIRSSPPKGDSPAADTSASNVA